MSAIRPLLQPWFEKPERLVAYYPKLPFARYQQLPGVNASLLKCATAADMTAEIPGFYDDDDEEDGDFTEKESATASKALGEAAHKAVLEPDLFDTDGWETWFQWSPTKGLATKAANAARLADPTRVLITEKIRDQALRIRDAVHEHHWSRKYLEHTTRELSGLAWDDEHGVNRKIRVDARSGKGGDYLWDLKTTRLSLDNIGDIKREIYKMGYDMQAAYYLDTDAILVPAGRKTRFLFCFVQNAYTKKPKVRGFEMPENWINDARTRYLNQLGMFLQAAHDNQWFAYQHEEYNSLPYTSFQPS